MVPVEMLGVQAGECVLDLCAAPGGKSVALAERLGGAGRLVAVDKSRRLARLRENVARFPQGLVEVREGDVLAVGREWAAEVAGEALFDAVLLDAPCSNTGVLRRRVDAKWRLSEESVLEAAALQLALLRAASACVRSGGRLVYSTCSVEEEENAGVVSAFLAGPEGAGFVLREQRLSFPWECGHDGGGSFLLIRG